SDDTGGPADDDLGHYVHGHGALLAHRLSVLVRCLRKVTSRSAGCSPGYAAGSLPAVTAARRPRTLMPLMTCGYAPIFKSQRDSQRSKPCHICVRGGLEHEFRCDFPGSRDHATKVTGAGPRVLSFGGVFAVRPATWPIHGPGR